MKVDFAQVQLVEKILHLEEAVHEVHVHEVLAQDLRQEVQDLDLRQLQADHHEGLLNFPSKHEDNCK